MEATESPPREEPAELIGTWIGYHKRLLILSATVKSFGPFKKGKQEVKVSRYDYVKLPTTDLARQEGICALFRFVKTEPESERYTVAFFADGRRAHCDCKWGTYRGDDPKWTPCVHISTLLTLADLTFPINVRPDHFTTSPPQVTMADPTAFVCGTCGGVGLIPDDLGLHHCPDCTTPTVAPSV